jgi:hypothetical protein
VYIEPGVIPVTKRRKKKKKTAILMLIKNTHEFKKRKAKEM